MWNCQNTEDKLFEHLYGLLDQQEQNLLTSHCAVCDGCGEKLKKAQGQKRDFGESIEGSISRS